MGRLYARLLAALVVFQLLWSETSASGGQFNTAFGQDGKFYCPKKTGVVSFNIYKGPVQQDGFKDYRFSFDCSRFSDPDSNDKGMEMCVTRFEWTMGDDVLMDDHFRSCSCDEYLAGIKTQIKTVKGVRMRKVQFRCCHSSMKVHNITSCYFTGQRSLELPYPTEVRTKLKPATGIVEGIQTIAVVNGYVIGRVCDYLVKGVQLESLDWWANDCWSVKQRGIKDILDKLKSMMEECKIYLSSPFGWPEMQNSLSNRKNMDERSDRLYEKQTTMCKDGSYLYAIYKFPIQGDKGKDYIFLTRCHKLTYTVCYCFWKQNCTKPEKRNTSEANKTMYVAGWRSEWSEEEGRRKFEMWCCKSDGLKIAYCNLTKNYTDNDTSLVIARPRYKFFSLLNAKAWDGQIIRDVDHWYKEGVLQLRFNICNVNGSDGECDKPCKTCKDIDPTMAICRPPVVVVPVPNIPCPKGDRTAPQGSCTADDDDATTGKATGATGRVACGGACFGAYNSHLQKFECGSGSAGAQTCLCTYDLCKQCQMDVNFLLDSSGSLQQSGYDAEKDFLRTVVSKLTLNENASRVSLTEFDTVATQRWDFDVEQSQSAITARINALTWKAGSTNIASALQTAIPIFQAQKRDCIPQVAILLTDGRHNTGPESEPNPYAAQLRNMGVAVYAVGEGPEANFDILTQITGDPKKTFMVSLDSVTSIADSVLAQVCADANQIDCYGTSSSGSSGSGSSTK